MDQTPMVFMLLLFHENNFQSRINSGGQHFSNNSQNKIKLSTPLKKDSKMFLYGNKQDQKLFICGIFQAISENCE
jgi:hypothetical protein